MLAIILAAATINSYAATPQAAALQIVYNTHAVPFVQRINVVGRYATVLVGAGMMEGSDVASPILLERFSFGWQPLEVVNQSCDLYGHIRDGKVANALMRQMPAMKIEQRACIPTADAGPTNDVAAIRRSMRGPLVPSVAVAGDWAKGTWYGAGGGEDIFKRTDGRWKLIVGAGGVFGVEDMPRYGVPKSVWCSLRVYNATCRR